MLIIDSLFKPDAFMFDKLMALQTSRFYEALVTMRTLVRSFIIVYLHMSPQVGNKTECLITVQAGVKFGIRVHGHMCWNIPCIYWVLTNNVETLRNKLDIKFTFYGPFHYFLVQPFCCIPCHIPYIWMVSHFSRLLGLNCKIFITQKIVTVFTR